MTKTKDQTHRLALLHEQLNRVRQHSLAAARNNDFRAVARLTGEAARLNRLILATEGAPLSAPTRFNGTPFAGNADRFEPVHQEAEAAVA